MNRTTVTALSAVSLLAVLLTGCNDSAGSRGAAPTGSPAAETSPPGQATPASPEPTREGGGPAGDPTGAGAAPDGRTVTIELWLTRDGKLFPTKRTRPHTVSTTKLALRELIAGENSAESAAGVHTMIPSSTTFTASVSGGVATVSFPRAFYDGGRATARLRQAQVVYTLTQFSTVQKVGFQINGEPAGWPVDRAEYADLLPAITVTSLVIGQRVTSPVTIAGTANVFEATVSVRILDASGREIATGFTTATCGSGCRGRYSTTLAYRVGTAQPGRVQAYAVSAKDGSRINVVDIPVRLVP